MGFSIGGRLIGSEVDPFIIAEMSGNHNHSLDRAFALVEAAARAGAHALKVQTYTPDTMTLDISEGAFLISDPSSPWFNKSLYELYQEASTPYKWHRPIFELARKLDLIPFSTPFDESAVEFLEELEVPCYKVASFENTDLPLIRRIARTGKPIIISTGMASLAEIEESVAAARDAGCRDLVLLKCTSNYPASPSDSNLSTMADMKRRFGCEVGISDHTMGVGASIAAAALGATVIEKHLTLRRADGGVDATFSLEPEEMAILVRETQRAWQSVGKVKYGTTSAEEKSLTFRRSLFIVEDLEVDAIITTKNLRVIRPGLGLPPKYYESLLGKRVNRPVRRGTPASWDLFS